MPTINLSAVCSECFVTQDVEIDPRRAEIKCEACTHSVPMFEKRDIGAIMATLAVERKKMYIALLLFAGTVFLFGLYVWTHSGEDMVTIPSDDPEKPYVGEFVTRDESSITLRDPETKEEFKYNYDKTLKTQMMELWRANPLLTKEQAAKRAAEEHVEVTPRERPPLGMALLVLSVMGALASIIFSLMATTDRLVCEF
jgi:hypothetical protein